jgi:hypothetical protein
MQTEEETMYTLTNTSVSKYKATVITVAYCILRKLN